MACRSLCHAARPPALDTTYQPSSTAVTHAYRKLTINWDNLTAGQIADFVSGRAQQLSLVSRQNPATAIRSLLRFLGGEGLIRTGLDGAVPPIWRSKHATVPRHVSAEQLENLLALCPSEG
jgi:hypothetical protein